MFCRNCGAEMSDNATFCPKCGTARTGVEEVVNQKEILEDNQIKYALKPVFNVLYKFLCNLSQAIIYTIVLWYLFYELIDVMHFKWNAIFLVIAAIALYILVKMIFGKYQYNDMEYNFYNTKVEYKDGFLNKEEKELKYKYVREVTMSQGIFERIFKIGTIRIFTNATSGVYNGRNHNGMMGRNGIYIHCVENVKEQYEKIKQIIDEGSGDE